MVNKNKLLWGAIIFYQEGGCLFVMGGGRIFGVIKGEGYQFFQRAKGGQIFFEVQRGGTKIFPHRQREDQNFLRMQREGDQKKLPTGHHRQMAPTPGKK